MPRLYVDGWTAPGEPLAGSGRPWTLSQVWSAQAPRSQRTLPSTAEFTLAATMLNPIGAFYHRRTARISMNLFSRDAYKCSPGTQRIVPQAPRLVPRAHRIAPRHKEFCPLGTQHGILEAKLSVLEARLDGLEWLLG